LKIKRRKPILHSMIGRREIKRKAKTKEPTYFSLSI
jgi:hypothetical protein